MKNQDIYYRLGGYNLRYHHFHYFLFVPLGVRFNAVLELSVSQHVDNVTFFITTPTDGSKRSDTKYYHLTEEELFQLSLVWEENYSLDLYVEFQRAVIDAVRVGDYSTFKAQD